MSKVVYLFGAGASAQRLPIIATLTDSIGRQIEWIEKNESGVNDSDQHQSLGRTSRALLLEYRDTLKRLPEEVAPYATIDLYARWLETNRDFPKLDRFKATVITFFAIEQYIHGFDPRYEGFFGSILDHGRRKLPDDVLILTWNYDQHIAMALARAGQHSDLGEVMQQHGIRTLFRLTRGQVEDFRILHLNGIAGFNARAQDRPMHDSVNGRSNWGKPLEEMAYFFGMLYHDRFTNGEGQMLLSYSWEALAESKTPWEKVTTAVAQADELVVVGYSFPDFNRVVDLKLIAAMKGLQRVIIQSPKASIEGLLTKLTMIAPELESKLVPYPLVHEFYVPNRLLVR
jgi:hypothetical protein